MYSDLKWCGMFYVWKFNKEFDPFSIFFFFFFFSIAGICFEFQKLTKFDNNLHLKMDFRFTMCGVSRSNGKSKQICSHGNCVKSMRFGYFGIIDQHLRIDNGPG